MKKLFKSICIIALCILLFTIFAFAHSGRTDSSGGHRNHSTGEYHYHHGYSAHDHYDMDGDGIKDCPYDFDEKTNHSSGSSSNSDTTSSSKTEGNNETNLSNPNDLTFGEILLAILKIIGVSALVLLLGSVFWLLAYRVLVPLLTWICKTILRISVTEETISNISIITIVVLVVTVTSIAVLSSL